MVGIVDGDTLTVLVGKRRVRVRVAGIDASEKKQVFGIRSRQNLQRVLKGIEVVLRVGAFGAALSAKLAAAAA